MLKEIYFDLARAYTDDTNLITVLWEEIEKAYTEKGRQYHTQTHLENLLFQLTHITNEISNYNTMLFSLFYHDIIYDVLKLNNEEQSARLAVKRLHQISVPDLVIQHCTRQILATKTHVTSDDKDTNFFTDADLSVLGQDWSTYYEYSKLIRKEYSIYPDLLYKPGRRKVLKHFLGMERIFKTSYFNTNFEEQAKVNMQKELALIS